MDIRTRRKVRIGEILVENGFITKELLHDALMRFDHKRKKLGKILIAEESRIISQIIEKVLKKHGYEVFKANSGEKAFSIAKEVNPDILIAGGLMADMKGHDLCNKFIHSTGYNDLHMVIISSDDSQQHVEKAFEAGVNHFLKKPVKETELINLIYQIEREAFDKRLEKILVVDDSRGARTIIRNELRSAGYTVYMAENGKQAIQKARRVMPDIITMDIEMPGMDGFEACRHLKENDDTRDIPVIIVSSLTSASLVEKGFAAGAVEYFTKPFKQGRLVAYINMLLESKKINKGHNILVAEDSKTTRHIIEYLLTKNGYNVFCANNGDEALSLLPECSPDLILTDCYMPGKDGFAFTAEVKQLEPFKHVPIIMLTSAQKREDMLRGLACGAGDYIGKPFDEAELLARISSHILNKKLFDDVEEERNKLRKAEHRVQLLLDDLQERELRYRTLFENSTDAIFVLNTSGTFESANSATLDMFGFQNEEDIIKQRVDRLSAEFQPDGAPSSEKARGMIEKALSEGINDFEWIHKRLNGEEFYAHVRLTPLEIHERPMVQAAVRDITDRKRAEEIIQRQTNDLTERVKELNCLYGISKILEIDHISLEEILQGIVNLLPSSWQYPESACSRLTLRGKEYRTANFSESPWKQTAPVSVYRKAEGVLEVYYLEEKPERDEGPFCKEEQNLLKAVAERMGRIIERIEAEQQLQTREEQFRNLIEASPNPISIIREERYLYVNAAWENITGHNRKEAQVLNPLELVHADMRDKVKDFISDRLEGKPVPERYELKVLNKKGDVIWLEMAATVIDYDDGPATLCIGADLTARKKMEEELERLSTIDGLT
ncbi:MAG: response regulator, partial [Eudoraea sp.]|nr:response regulator [Eudoraea sp.]